MEYRGFIKIIVLPFFLFTASAALGFLYETQGTHTAMETPPTPSAAPSPVPSALSTSTPSSSANPKLDQNLSSDQRVELTKINYSTQVPQPKALACEAVETKMPLAERYGILSFTSDFYSTQIAATDKTTQGNANLFSRSNYSFGLEYNHLFNPSFRSIFYFQSRRLEMIPPLTGNLSNNVVNLYSFGVGGQFWSEHQKFGLGLKLGEEQIPILRGISTSQFEIDQLSVPQLSLGLTWNLYNEKPYTIGTDFMFIGDFPTNSSSYQSSFNTGFETRFFIRQDVSPKFRFELGAEGRYINEDTSIATQQQTDLGLDLRLSIPLGGVFQ